MAITLIESPHRLLNVGKHDLTVNFGVIDIHFAFANISAWGAHQQLRHHRHPLCLHQHFGLRGSPSRHQLWCYLIRLCLFQHFGLRELDVNFRVIDIDFTSTNILAWEACCQLRRIRHRLCLRQHFNMRGSRKIPHHLHWLCLRQLYSLSGLLSLSTSTYPSTTFRIKGLASTLASSTSTPPSSIFWIRSPSSYGKGWRLHQLRGGSLTSTC